MRDQRVKTVNQNLGIPHFRQRPGCLAKYSGFAFVDVLAQFLANQAKNPRISLNRFRAS